MKYKTLQSYRLFLFPIQRLSILWLLIFISSCSSTQIYVNKKATQAEKAPIENSELLYTLYMIGDAGDAPSSSKFVLQGLKKKIANSNPQKSGVIFLGDNIYPYGLRKKNHPQRQEDEQRINAQLDILKNYQGDIVFISGNHDWNKYGEDGLKFVKRQERYIEKYLNNEKAFLPSNGCPGPEVVKLAPGLVMIIIDTQWWLHQLEKSSGEKDGCDVRNTEELLVQFKDLLKKYRNQNIIVAAHHPLYSNGEHGGHFKLKYHIFPFTALNKNLYIPLPIAGSIYPFYRRYFGASQDITHPIYQDMVNKLTKAINEYENVTYIAGHEHNLQFTNQENIHHIISGSGSKTSPLVFNKNIEFGAIEKGYSRIKYYANGELWVEFFTINNKTGKEAISFRKLLFKRDIVKNEPVSVANKKSYKGMFATVVPDSTFAAGKIKRLFFGDLNRDLWTTPLNVPYLDIHFEKGGLTPIKKGGGMQTLSLRLLVGDGKQYSIRGIKKNATFLIEKSLRGTLAQDIIYDGIAGSHPYASIAIPTLSDAVNIYHSNPKLVYVPKDSILGDYMDEFGGMFCLFEERPDGDMSDEVSFGNSENVMNYSKAIEKMHKKYNHVPDAQYIVRARLFDMLIGDWDRHDDQWRWASFKEGEKVLYRPIPRDRDQAFFEFDGIFMSIANRKWLLRKFQPFNADVRDIAGLCFNARYFDRSFLIEPTQEDWIQQAQYIQKHLTDEVIEKAIRELPDEGFAVTGKEIIATLKTRRDKLTEFAKEYYKILAKNVNIPGTLKEDYFEIKRLENGKVEVSIYPIENKQKIEEKRYFHRIFKPNETKEIRLYGLDGKDEFKIEGSAKHSILVRVVAGFEKDYIQDSSKVRGLRNLTKIYDTKGKNEIKKGSETSLKLMKDENAYDYNRKAFKYNKLTPLISIGYNDNDGLYIGPGFSYTNYGFKKTPYKSKHKILANRTFGSKGYNFLYKHSFIDAVGKAEFNGILEINAPEIYQYYGTLNKPILSAAIPNYNVFMNKYQYTPELKFTSQSQAHQLGIGLNLLYVDFDKEPLAPVENWETNPQSIIAPQIEYHYENKDNKNNPLRGVHYSLRGSWNKSVNNDNIDYTHLKTTFSLFQPIYLDKRQTTIGMRSGMAINSGDYAFYQANFLDGVKNFRGVLKNRYPGKTIFFNNLDLRKSLFKLPNNIVPFDLGVIGHYDIAKIWNDKYRKSPTRWYTSYGGGTFINILDYLILVGTYSISEHDQLFTLSTNFLF